MAKRNNRNLPTYRDRFRLRLSAAGTIVRPCPILPLSAWSLPLTENPQLVEYPDLASAPV
jgi:hypothetical protein